MNARFWIWENDGFVKITMKPKQSLTWFTGGPCDEGYSRRWETWEWTGEFLYSRCETDSRDCDGSYSSSMRHVSHAFNLRSHLPLGRDNQPDREHPMPKWTTLSRSQRDFSAEAMGY